MKFGPISNSGFAQIEVNKSTTLFPRGKKTALWGFGNHLNCVTRNPSAIIPELNALTNL